MAFTPSFVREAKLAHLMIFSATPTGAAVRSCYKTYVDDAIVRSFPSHPHLREPNGPIVSLLQAYLIMVPDIVYEQGPPGFNPHLDIAVNSGL